MFNENPKVTPLTLEPQQHLSDLDLKIEGRLRRKIHLEAPTGTGKSTLVIEKLSKKMPVIMAVPQLAQVKQLKSIYGESKKIGEANYILYVHGGVEIPNSIKSYKMIVTTYDGLSRIVPRVTPRHYALVIDEAHKLYQAADYRSLAINQMVAHIDNCMFRQVITLSAKLNPKLMPFNYDEIFTIDKQPIEKELKIHLFKKGKPAREKLLKAQPSKKGQLVLLRVNNKDEIEEFAAYYENRGLKTLKITSDLQKTQEVSQTFCEEKIPEGYDVVLTTSLTDEAININNTNIESVHILGGRLHSEELLQFIGRFRKKAPPFHQYLSAGQLGFYPEIDLDEERNNLLAVAQAYKKIYETHHRAMRKCMTLAQFNEFSRLTHKTSFLRFTNHENAKEGIEINHIGINNRLYQIDLQNQYHSKNSLVAAYKNTVKGLKVTVKSDSIEASDGFISEMKDAQKLVDDEYRALIEHCAEQIGYKDVERGDQHHQLVEDYCATTELHTPEGQIARTWKNLSSYYLHDQNQIMSVLINRNQEFVTHFVYAAKHNPLVIAILLHLKKQPVNVTLGEKEAKKKVVEALQKLFKWRPDIKECLRTEKEKTSDGIWIKTNNHIGISDSLVRRIYENYTNTEVKRSNSKYKFHFNGVRPLDLLYKIDYLKYPVSPEAEKEMIMELKTTTKDKKGLRIHRPMPKRKKKFSTTTPARATTG